MKKLLLPLGLIFILSACQKELSVEDGTPIIPPPGGTGTIGNNCKLQQILAINPANSAGLYSIYTQFNSAGVATKVEGFDSTTSTMDFEASFIYTGDTIRVSPVELFLTDAQKRVKAFHTVDNSGSAIDSAYFAYAYNGEGYLISKTAFLVGIPFPLAVFTYTWSGGNLVAVKAVSNLTGSDQKVFEASLEYDGNAVAKNFIPVYPDGIESSLYIMGLNIGKPSRNLVKKVVATTYDENGNVDSTLTSTYSDYKYSSDGYLIEWTVGGDLLGGSPFFTGRSAFKYYCP
ncbi:hypothetical protein [Pollutibacter soli]|uniref:hypothetical protein n=1 Tax=Pollutibacter soli TaxID=3034157 RepID=UPI003013C1EB